MNRARVGGLLDDSLLGEIAVSVVVVVVELEEPETSLGAFAAQRRCAALGLGDIAVLRLGDSGKGLGRERLLRDARGEGEEVQEGAANRGEGLAAGRHGEWKRFFCGKAWVRRDGIFGWESERVLCFQSGRKRGVEER